MSASTAQANALPQAREHGLWGRADSPPEWQKALQGGTAGDPILVKDPSDPRDDFFLVPIRPLDPAATRSAWIMLDAVTFKLREASLLDHWKFPAFPDEKDARQISQTALQLPDGTRAQFTPKDLKPNHKNLVWRAGDASILPYWPVKEWTAPHPVTGEPVSVYVTQEGEILTTLTGSTHVKVPESGGVPKKSSPLRLILTLAAGVAIGVVSQTFRPDQAPTVITNERVKSGHFESEIQRLTGLLEEEKARGGKSDQQTEVLTTKLAESNAEVEKWKHQTEILTTKLAKSNAEIEKCKHQTEILTTKLTESNALAEDCKRQTQDITKQLDVANAQTDQCRRQIERLTNLKAEADMKAAESERQIEVLKKELADCLNSKPNTDPDPDRMSDTQTGPKSDAQPDPMLNPQPGPKSDTQSNPKSGPKSADPGPSPEKVPSPSPPKAKEPDNKDQGQP